MRSQNSIGAAFTTCIVVFIGALDLQLSDTISSIHIMIQPTSSPIVSASATASQVMQFQSATATVDPTVLAAFVGLGGAILVAIISGFLTLYQIRRSEKLHKEGLEAQHRFEQEMRDLERNHQEEIFILQKEIEQKYKTIEQEEQNRISSLEASKQEMLRARTTEERIQAYRNALKVDPRISRLQILDMNRSVDILSVYIRLKVHQHTPPSYKLDNLLLSAEAQHDPNVLLWTEQIYLERRLHTAIEPEEAISNYTRCIILGDPGAGKTTLLKYLTLKAASQQLLNLSALPIYIELNSFANSGSPNLFDFIIMTLDQHYDFPKAEAQTYLEKCLKEGKALVLLDGLDEAVIGDTPEQSENSYTHVVKAITQMATRYHQLPIVVTARRAGYKQRAPLPSFTELDVLDFRLEDIQRFVSNWFDCNPIPNAKKRAAELSAKLEQSPRIRSLATNPLLLSLIVLVYEAQLDLPDRRTELYRYCIDTLLTDWDTKRSIRRRREFKPEQKRQLLEELAWIFHSQGRRYFPESDVLAEIAKFLPSIRLPADQNKLILSEIASENGLIKEQARGWHGFFHLTLQEYFAARYAAENSKLEILLTHLGNPWWEEVLLLYAGQVPDAGPLLQRLFGSDTPSSMREDLFHTNLIFAGHCLSTHPTIRQPSLWENTVFRLFEVLRTTPYSLTRKRIINILVTMKEKDITARLLNLITDRQFEIHIRVSIADSLGQFGERLIASELLHMLTNKYIEVPVRVGVAKALGKLEEQSIATEMLEMLSNRKIEASVRMSIADSLGRLRERSFANKMLKMLVNRRIEAAVRMSIADALGWLGERSIAPEMLSLISNENLESIVREHIARALSWLGESSITPGLLDLLPDLRLESSIRVAVAETLGRLGDKTVIPQMLALHSERDRIGISVYGALVEAIGRLGDKSMVPELLHQVSNQRIEANLRTHIAEVLGDIGDKSIVPELLQYLPRQWPEVAVRMFIADSLGKLGDSSIIAELMQLLANRKIEKPIRSRIAHTISMLSHDSQIITIFASQLQDSDIPDTLHTVLWELSCQQGVRIFPSEQNLAVENPFEIVPW